VQLAAVCKYLEGTAAMLTRKQQVQLSKLLSLMLRHQPQRFGVALDAEGYASIEEVLRAVRASLPEISTADLRYVVEHLEPDKRRFSMADGEIRANYGHTLTQRIVHEAAQPPDLLLHGTSRQALPQILELGILPMKRQYVHLTTDRNLAARIGARHGAAHILTIDASQAARDGLLFYRANQFFWLADAVPLRYVTLPE
jgi:putative RNA 2'-phosphotransferase